MTRDERERKRLELACYRAVLVHLAERDDVPASIEQDVGQRARELSRELEEELS